MKNEDQKDAEVADDMVFDMLDVTVPGTIGRTSLVPVLASQADTDTARTFRPTGLSGLALDILDSCLAGPQSAQLPPSEDLPGNTRGVSLEVFRCEWDARNAQRLPDARRKAFMRAIDALVEYRLIGLREPWIWRVR